MKIKTKTAAVLGLILAVPTLIEGGSVLLGTSNPDQIVLKWLVTYNVAAALFSLFVIGQLWMNRTGAKKLSVVMLAAHSVVFLTLIAIFFINGHVALKSIAAMGIRTMVWAVINLIIINRSKP